MKINLNKIKTHLLTVPDNNINYLYESINNKLNVNIHYGILHENRSLGCALGKFLIFYKISENEPFLFLEDDCVITKNFQNEILIPDDADAVYLGISEWGMKNNEGKLGNFDIQPVLNYNLYKISGMMSTHAILYISERYINAIKNFFKQFKFDGACDYLITSLHKNYNIYTVPDPFFYQAGIHKDTTNISLNYIIDKYKNNVISVI